MLKEPPIWKTVFCSTGSDTLHNNYTIRIYPIIWIRIQNCFRVWIRGPYRSRFMKKTKGQKSRAAVPLSGVKNHWRNLSDTEYIWCWTCLISNFFETKLITCKTYLISHLQILNKYRTYISDSKLYRYRTHHIWIYRIRNWSDIRLVLISTWGTLIDRIIILHAENFCRSYEAGRGSWTMRWTE
jgi:hypothetical protein